MSRHLLLICKRLLLLTLVIGLSWFTLFKLFPFIDDRLPWAVALILTYIFIAYVGLPALVRVHQALAKPNHVPTRSLTGDGWAVDPINLVVVARNEKDFVWAMQKAGWYRADERTLKNNFRMIYATIFNRPYPTAPFTPHYVFGRRQDLGFEIPIGSSPRHRHHVRFWRLGTTLLDDEHEHQGFWRTLLKRFVHEERQVWVGAATTDRGLTVQWRDLQINHSIDADTMSERQFVVDSLQTARMLKDTVDIKAGEPLHTRHQGFGETIIADGYVKLCEIKRQILPPVTPAESPAKEKSA